MTMEMRSGPGFFEGDVTLMVNRRQARHAMLVDGFRHAISDSTVLLLGAEDGGWCYTFAAAGALQVVGVERDAELVEKFLTLPDIGLRERIDLRHAEPLDELEAEALMEQRYDIVAMFDFLEDRRDIIELFELVARLKPQLVLVDGLFDTSGEAVFALDKHRRSVAKRKRSTLIPSRGIAELAASEIGYDLDWLDWNNLSDDARMGLSDYYQQGRRCRGSYVLTPSHPAE